jgi:5-methylcytosine-specific restriction endonuclease McrA
VIGYSRSQLSDEALLHQLKKSISRDRVNTAALLADLAEVDARKLYLPAGHPSMYAYCVAELGLCEQAAFKRIRAARTARAFPAIFAAVADGRLNLSGVILLAPFLNEETADDLLTAVMHKRRSEIEQILAERFPSSEVLPMIHALPGAGDQLSPGTVETDREVAQRAVGGSAPARIEPLHSKVAPIAAERFAVQVTVSKATRDKLRYAQCLLGHRIPNGDLAEVLDRVLDLAIGQLEKQKFAATDRPRQPRGSTDPRTIPADVQRAVWQREGGQCSFVGSTGHRCSAREKLEFDHIEPVARGGPSTADNLRLRCRAHNQYEADRVFGAEFMNGKRRERAEVRKMLDVASRERVDEVAQCLRQLRYHADEARRAAEFSDALPEASLEDRVKRALSYFAPRVTRPAGTG